MNDVRELMKEAELVQIRPLGMLARVARGPAPAMGAPYENQFDVRTGFAREGATGFVVVFSVDCRSRKTRDDAPFARFVYHVAISYRAKQAWADDVVATFAQTNAAIHAWPYARQYVHAASTQLGLSPVLLPALRVGQAVSASAGSEAGR